MFSIATVLGLSAAGCRGSLGTQIVELKRVLISVVLPKPDSPFTANIRRLKMNPGDSRLTYDHDSELEPVLEALAPNLVWEVGKANMARNLLACRWCRGAGGSQDRHFSRLVGRKG